MTSALESRSELLTRSEVAGRLGVSDHTVWRWTTAGIRGVKLRHTPIGARIHYSPADIESFLGALRGDGPATQGSARQAKPRRGRTTAAAKAILAKHGIAINTDAKGSPE